MARHSDTIPSLAPPPLPERVGPYRIEGVIGSGGMGLVYRARDESGAPVAVKVLRAALASEDVVRRFEREASIRIEHPNVIRVLGAGCDAQGTPYIAFELLEGETMDQYFLHGPLSPTDAREFGVQVARGLSAAHKLGIVHRDLKPGNMFRCQDGTIKLLDFGIARWMSRETRLTAAGSVVGTPSYLSPEQAHGDVQLDGRADLWALGAVLYEALSGRAPFERDSALATMLAVLVEDPLPLSVVTPNVPAGLAAVVERCLLKPRDRRWASADALGAALERADLTPPSGSIDADIRSRATGQQTAPTVSLPPGEQRLVAVLLAEGVRQPELIAAAVRERGGMVVALAGGRTVGIFGAEKWEGDEITRAAEAALTVRPSATRMAIASGRAARAGAGGIGGSALRQAEELCRADLDGVAVDAETARALGGAFALRPAQDGVFELRPGRREDTPTLGSAPYLDQPTRGREAEIAQMRLGLRTVLEEERALVVLVTGPPGIGKSRMRRELERMIASTEPNVVVLGGRAESMRREQALSLWGSVLLARAQRGTMVSGWPRIDVDAPPEERRRAVWQLAHEGLGDGVDADALAPFIGLLVGVELAGVPGLTLARKDPQLMADRLRIAIVDWLGGLLSIGPVALVLDDLQWADQASLELLEDVVGRCEHAPLLVFASARPELVDARPDLFSGRDVLRVEPRGLVPSDVAKMARNIVGSMLSDAAAKALAERTAGNPLFVEQICLSMMEGHAEAGDTASWPMPRDVESAVQSRLDHLPTHEKELCKRASVYGRPFTVKEIEALGTLGASALLASLCRRDVMGARSRSFASPDREHFFRSTLVSEVAYRTMTDELRADLHRKAAAHLEQAKEVGQEEVALHHERGGEREQAAARFAGAALDATSHGDPMTVLRCSERALELGVPTDAWFELFIARSEAQELLGRFEEEARDLANASDWAVSDADRARALTRRAAWASRMAKSDEAEKLAGEAVTAARRARDPEVLANACGKQAAVLIYSGKLEEAGEALREAEALAIATAPRLRAQAATWRAQLASAQGDLGERRDAYRTAVKLYEEQGDLRRAAGAAMNLADALNRVGAYAEAEEALRAACASCRRVRNRLMEGYALVNLGYSLTMLGRPDEAIAALGEAGTVAEQSREPRLVLFVKIYRARALLAASRLEGAAEEAEAAWEQADVTGLGGLAVLGLTVAAAARLAMGDRQAALTLSERALRRRDELGGVEEDEAEVFLVRARALEAAGRRDEAGEVRMRGRSRLQYIARRIADAEWRARFLRDVPTHRELGTEKVG